MEHRLVALTSFPRSQLKLHDIHFLYDNLKSILARTLILHMLVVLDEGHTKTEQE